VLSSLDSPFPLRRRRPEKKTLGTKNKTKKRSRSYPERKPPRASGHMPSKSREERMKGILNYRNIYVKVFGETPMVREREKRERRGLAFPAGSPRRRRRFFCSRFAAPSEAPYYFPRPALPAGPVSHSPLADTNAANMHHTKQPPPPKKSTRLKNKKRRLTKKPQKKN